MDVRDYIKVLRRNWLLIASALVLSLIVGGLYTLLQAPEYEATSKAFVSTPGAGSLADLSSGATFTQQLVQSYADVATTPFVLQKVIDDLHLDLTTNTLSREVSAIANSSTVVIQINVLDKSPARAAEIANSVTQHLSTAVVGLAPSSTNSGPLVKITQLQPAVAPDAPARPQISLYLVLAIAAGLALGITAAILRELLDTRVRAVGDLSEVTDRPLLGVVSWDTDTPRHPLTLGSGQRFRGEQYRILRTNLQYLPFESESRMLVVTSSLEGEGKSTSAGNLALSIASVGRRVLLIDADLRRPNIDNIFGIEGAIGLTDVLVGAAHIGDAVQPWGAEGLHILPAGRIPPNPSELLQSRAMSELILTLKADYDTIVVDAPPILPVTDATIIAKLADGAIVVCAAGRVTQSEVTTALASLDKVRARVLGLLLTMVPNHGPDAYGYSRYYSRNEHVDRQPA